MPATDKRPLKVFLCHAHADRDPVHGLPAGTRLTKDRVDAWLDKAKPCGEPRRTILPGQGFDTVSERRTINLPDWALEIRKAVREIIDV